MKPIDLYHSNGLAADPQETVAILSILAKVAFKPSSLTNEDSGTARALLLKAALIYPQYAEASQHKHSDTAGVRPALSPIRDAKKRR